MTTSFETGFGSHVLEPYKSPLYFSLFKGILDQTLCHLSSVVLKTVI